MKAVMMKSCASDAQAQLGIGSATCSRCLVRAALHQELMEINRSCPADTRTPAIASALVRRTCTHGHHASAPVQQSRKPAQGGRSVKRQPIYASDYNQSRFVKWQDIGEAGSTKSVTIKDVTEETLTNEQQQEETKPCVWFNEF